MNNGLNIAEQEFQIGSEKYTSECLTLNGKEGRMWTKWVKQSSGAWAHDGIQHLRAKASDIEVMVAFD